MTRSYVRTALMTVATTFLLIQPPSLADVLLAQNSSRGSAPKSWCIGVKEQWEFRWQHFNEDSESLRAMFEDGNCQSWGLYLPPRPQYQSKPSSWR